MTEIKADANESPFPTISIDEFRKKYIPDVDNRELLKYLAEDLAQEVAEGKITQDKADMICAVAEIKAISIGARYHIQHTVRNHMQIIAGLSEEWPDNLLPLSAQERFKAIQEAVTQMSEDMRRLGL